MTRSFSKWKTAPSSSVVLKPLKIKRIPLGGCIGLFSKHFFSNFCFHIKDSKWGRNCIFINCRYCNWSPQQIPFQFANGKLPHSRCRAFWAWSCSRDLGLKYKRQNNLYKYLFKYLTGLPIIDFKINANILSLVIFSY